MAEALDIRLRPDASGRVAAVEIASSRLVTASAVLRGKPVGPALGLLPLVFALCGQAQRIAGARAVEAALGLEPDARTVAVRCLRLAAEAVQELAMPMLMDWPRAIGAAPEVTAARALRSGLAPLWKPFTAQTLGGALLAAETVLRAVEAPLGRLLDRVQADGLAGLGSAVPVSPLPVAVAPLAAALAADHDGAFRRAPVWLGAPAETGALTRQWGHPLLTAVRGQAPGAGLAMRLEARHLDLAAQVAALRDAAAPLWHDGETLEETALPAMGGGGCGFGWTEAARGTLAHWVMIEDGLVRDWRILAPTEWNFHPRGVIGQALVGAEADPRAARLLALALDPCVACAVSLGEPA